jgi:putative oxidoreductase
MDKLSRYAPHALAALRIVAALLFMQHGTSKLFGFPEMAGHGAPGPSSPGGLSLLMFVGALLELFGGLAILAGFLTRPVAFVLAGEMAFAYWFMHVPSGGFFPLANGGDLAVLFCFVFLYLVFAGPGALSLDGTRAPARGSS